MESAMAKQLRSPEEEERQWQREQYVPKRWRGLEREREKVKVASCLSLLSQNSLVSVSLA